MQLVKNHATGGKDLVVSLKITLFLTKYLMKINFN